MANITKALKEEIESCVVGGQPNATVFACSMKAKALGLTYEQTLEVVGPLVRKQMRGENPTPQQFAKYVPKKVKYTFKY